MGVSTNDNVNVSGGLCEFYVAQMRTLMTKTS